MLPLGPIRFAAMLAAVILGVTLPQSGTAHPRGTRSVEHLVGFEAVEGTFRHVAGSACCHPFADPRQVATAHACEKLCFGYEPCDAFVHSPSSQLCFLIRFKQRGQSSVATQPAPDRTFGLVRGGSGTDDAESTEQKGGASANSGSQHKRSTQSSGSHRSKKKKAGKHGKKKSSGHSRDSHFGPGMEFMFEDYDCDVCGNIGDEFRTMEGPGPEIKFASFDSFAEFFGQFHKGNTDKKYKDGSRAGSRSQSESTQEHCDVEDAEFIFSDEDMCSCDAPSEWERNIRQQIWPSQEECTAECAVECSHDFDTMRNKAREIARKLARSLFGEESETAFLFEMGMNENEQDTYCHKVCHDTCLSVTSNASCSSKPTEEVLKNQHRNKFCPANITQEVMVTVEELSKKLHDIFDRAESRFSTDLMPMMFPEETLTMPFALGAAHLAPDEGTFDVLPPEIALFSNGGTGTAQLGLLERKTDEAQTLQNLMKQPTGAKDIRIPELWPTPQKLLKRIPEAARWAQGSPPFLERFREKALSRVWALFGGK